MRVKQVISLLGLASLGITAPTYEDICVPSISTVFATPSPIHVTVTVDRIHESTVYVTVPHTSTIVITELPSPSASLESVPQDSRESNISSSYDATVYETTYVTVTLDGSETSTAQGPLSYMVVDGTTSWLGETPAPGESLIFASSVNVVTVLPQKHVEPLTTIQMTTTVRSTIQTETTITVVKTPTSTAYVGIASFTGKPIGGWNVSTSSSARYETSLHYGGTAFVAKAPKPTLALDEPTFNLYSTTRASITISKYAAASGFRSYTTLTAPTLTSSPGGSTTAAIDGETYSWTAPAMPTEVKSWHPTPAYGNSTLSTFATVPSSNVSSSSLSATKEVSNSTSLLGTVTTSSVALTSTSVSSSPSASPTQCGITGNFEFSFDNIPALVVTNQSTPFSPLPVFNPYQKFKFSDGFFVVPPPRVRYEPSSKPLLLEFIPNFNTNITDEDSGPNSREFDWSGDIGNADQGRSGCFSYNMYGASLGCDSRSDDCVFTFIGFRYDRATKAIVEVTSQKLVIAACPKSQSCPLTSVTLDSTFENLDQVRMNLKAGGLPKVWWMDDLRLGWYDNSCSVGICRQNTRIR